MRYRRLIQMLKAEAKFIDEGGYGRPFRSTWRPTLLFRDSPTCLNFDPKKSLRPCTSCALIQLVPDDKYQERRPCHHIPITPQGDTIASLYRAGTQTILDHNFRVWLSETIQKLEQEESDENA